MELKKEGKKNIPVAGEEMRESDDDDDDDDEREDTIMSGTEDEIDDDLDLDSNSESSFVTSLSNLESESHNPEDSVHGELTGDYLQFVTGHDLQDSSRRSSVDSRLGVEGGNVGYESDEGFVVSDGEDEDENEEEKEEKGENGDKDESVKEKKETKCILTD